MIVVDAPDVVRMPQEMQFQLGYLPKYARLTRSIIISSEEFFPLCMQIERDLYFIVSSPEIYELSVSVLIGGTTPYQMAVLAATNFDDGGRRAW